MEANSNLTVVPEEDESGLSDIVTTTNLFDRSLWEAVNNGTVYGAQITRSPERLMEIKSQSSAFLHDLGVMNQSHLFDIFVPPSISEVSHWLESVQTPRPPPNCIIFEHSDESLIQLPYRGSSFGLDTRDYGSRAYSDRWATSSVNSIQHIIRDNEEDFDRKNETESEDDRLFREYFFGSHKAEDVPLSPDENLLEEAKTICQKIIDAFADCDKEPVDLKLEREEFHSITSNSVSTAASVESIDLEKCTWRLRIARAIPIFAQDLFPSKISVAPRLEKIIENSTRHTAGMPVRCDREIAKKISMLNQKPRRGGQHFSPQYYQ